MTALSEHFPKRAATAVFAVACVCRIVAASAQEAPGGRDLRLAEDRRIFAEALFSRGLYKQAAVEFERFLADFPESADSARAAFRSSLIV